MNLALPISLLFSSTGVTCHHNNNNNNNNKQHNTHIDAQYNSKQCKHQQPSTTPTYVCTVPINVCTYSTYQRMYVQHLCMYVCVYACTQHILCHSWGSPPSV